MKVFLNTLLISVLLFVPLSTFAQASSTMTYANTIFKAEVEKVITEGTRSFSETRLNVPFQKLQVRIIEGVRKEQVVEVENTSDLAFSVGEVLYVHRASSEDGSEFWSAGEPDRTPLLVLLAVLFVAITVLVGGLQGFRSLVSLAISLSILVLGLVPALYAGAPPVPTCIAVALLLLIISMLITHGWKKQTFIALLGSVVALAVAAFISEIAVTFAKLSGYASDEALYVRLATSGSLDLSALLLGGILIGIVGILNDISVSQVHTVNEIREANISLTRGEVLRKAIKVGREHLGAVVNTLPLAYAGAALPLLLLFSTSDAPLSFIINREVFSEEIIRILAGGIALSLSGALATVLAVVVLVPPKKSRGILKAQE